ncbi:hypothetical protein [Nocardioides panaciterrulae]|uniref:Uncharacterized protein n=1 Tax=Nocardioides panaciterrulae TaxID=661492 RepID=A0A7Y9E2P0_9ACTN|nr:hypothetical protein [Nocardioides panaciterrulae]NYD39930.1 hypothetical protein [Nocardioides panaciterrulae]NYD43962.1 hypothetical protein [Nocardioides panaciterrulae]
MSHQPTTQQPPAAPETQVSGRRSVSPGDVVLRAIRTHADYEVADIDTDGPDRCTCGAGLEWSRYASIDEVHQEHQADAILAALLREVLA